MKYLATGDIHITDNPRDEYRWDIFPWLAMQAQNRGADFIVILGDLTDRKDQHPGRMVNRLVEALAELRKVCPVYILKGNHDYDQDPLIPFFKFMPDFITEETEMTWPPGSKFSEHDRVLFYPYNRKFNGNERSWTGFDHIFLHQTFGGSVASNGFKMEGASTKIFRKSKVGENCVVLSGDIHVPQKCGNVIYVGSPHPVHFGDSFKPRVIFWDGEKLKSIKRTTIRKVVLTIRTIDELRESDLTPGDQLKVKAILPRSEFHQWADMRQQIQDICAERELILQGAAMEAEPDDAPDQDDDQTVVRTGRMSGDYKTLFKTFCDEKGIDSALVKAGKELL